MRKDWCLAEYHNLVWSANGPNLGTCTTPEVPSAALLRNDELVNAPSTLALVGARVGSPWVHQAWMGRV